MGLKVEHLLTRCPQCNGIGQIGMDGDGPSGAAVAVPSVLPGTAAVTSDTIPCPSCHGAGWPLTEAGKALLEFIQGEDADRPRIVRLG